MQNSTVDPRFLDLSHPPPKPPTLQPETSPVQPISPFPFNRLPPEIRQLIWPLTFTPRSLHIKIHVGGTPLNGQVSSAAHNWVMSCMLKIACICFTATESPIPNSSPFRLPQPPSGNGSGAIYPSMSTPPPPGPTAFYVCRESRAIALQHYELAFGGINYQPASDTEFAELWKKGGYGEKKIWVNFSIDTIFCTVDPGFGLARGIPVAQLVQYASEECGKIRYLGIDRSYSLGRENRASMGRDLIALERRLLVEELKKLKLERLIVWNVDEEEREATQYDRWVKDWDGRAQGRGVGEGPMWSIGCGVGMGEEEEEREREREREREKREKDRTKELREHERQVEIEREKERLKELKVLAGDIRRALEEDKRRCPAAWQGEVPEVEVRRSCFWGV